MTESTRSEPLLQHPQANCQLVLEGQDIGYRLQRSHRRTLGMRITQDGLAVSAPFWVTRGQVEHVLLSKAAWILRKLREHYLAGGLHLGTSGLAGAPQAPEHVPAAAILR